MSNIQKLSLIIPCFNEEGNVSRFEKEILEFFPPLVPSEFIFVDDGSMDETFSKLESLSSRFPSVILVRHDRNRGLGEAIKTGLKNATGDAVLTMDSDLTFHPQEFPKLFNAYGPQTDCVCGSPTLGRFDKVSFIRRNLSRSVNLVYQVLLRTNITATSSLFRLYRASSLKNISLCSRSFDINAEILSKLSLAGAEIREVPVVLSVREWGKSKIHTMREIANHVRLFLKILYWKGEKIFHK